MLNLPKISWQITMAMLIWLKHPIPSHCLYCLTWMRHLWFTVVSCQIYSKPLPLTPPPTHLAMEKTCEVLTKVGVFTGQAVEWKCKWTYIHLERESLDLIDDHVWVMHGASPDNQDIWHSHLSQLGSKLWHEHTCESPFSNIEWNALWSCKSF